AGTASLRFIVAPPKAEPVIVNFRANLTDESRALLASRVKLSRGDVAGAREALAGAEESDAVLTARARIQSLTRDLDGARTLLEQVLARSPRNSDALAAMGFISYEFQDYVMAERYLRKAMEISPSPALRSALGQIVSRQKL
ncbi:MAG: tetratricopeptide repeat protein, partial [Bryobacteraceae bacterium]|nr:tetratricopeptide repeat protein [Bryobacteraceae bacterium]